MGAKNDYARVAAQRIMRIGASGGDMSEHARHHGKKIRVKRKGSGVTDGRSGGYGGSVGNTGGHAAPNANAPLGQGGRFAALKQKLAARPGVKNPAALAASIGRKKYGAKRFGALSHGGH